MSLPADDRHRTGSKAPLIRVVVTGTESTGKSTLVSALGAQLAWPVVPESARLLVDELGRGLLPADLDRLVRMYRSNRRRALRQARRLGAPGILLDTDLYSSWVYAQHYMSLVPDWLKRSARGGAADLYLYCEPDIPLVPDSGQRGTVKDRRQVDRVLSELLAKEGQRVVRISGTRAERRWSAGQAIDEILA